VHLGKEFPPHLYRQLEQVRVFNENTPIYLIVNAAAEYNRRLIDELGVVVVVKEGLVKCRNHRLFSAFNRMNRHSLGGFWLFASERFFVIESFLAACRLEDIVHMENDVMLYAELDRLLPTLRSACPRIGITMDSEHRCIPGFVYVRDLEALSAMNAFLFRQTLRRRQNDMKALAAYMNASAGKGCSALPVLPSRYRAEFPLENTLGEKGTSPWYDEAFDAFGGIFDAAALGQYLGGIDTRLAGEPEPGFVNETAVYDPRKLGLCWKKDGKGLKRPYGRIGGSEFPIFNLHIHSKRMDGFGSKRADVE
jgi:hypothetical protein